MTEKKVAYIVTVDYITPFARRFSTDVTIAIERPVLLTDKDSARKGKAQKERLVNLAREVIKKSWAIGDDMITNAEIKCIDIVYFLPEEEEEKHG